MLKAIGVNVDLQVKDVTTYETNYNDPACCAVSCAPSCWSRCHGQAGIWRPIWAWWS